MESSRSYSGAAFAVCSSQDSIFLAVEMVMESGGKFGSSGREDPIWLGSSE